MPLQIGDKLKQGGGVLLIASLLIVAVVMIANTFGLVGLMSFAPLWGVIVWTIIVLLFPTLCE
jgi:hypothetical protein